MNATLNHLMQKFWVVNAKALSKLELKQSLRQSSRLGRAKRLSGVGAKFEI